MHPHLRLVRDDEPAPEVEPEPAHQVVVVVMPPGRPSFAWMLGAAIGVALGSGLMALLFG